MLETPGDFTIVAEFSVRLFTVTLVSVGIKVGDSCEGYEGFTIGLGLAGTFMAMVIPPMTVVPTPEPKPSLWLPPIEGSLEVDDTLAIVFADSG